MPGYPMPAKLPGKGVCGVSLVGDGAAERTLGKSPKPWKTEEWMLRTVGKGLVLAGHDGEGDPWSIGTAAGSMLAVYTLLGDRLGVRWFWPGEFGEHVPVNADTTIPPRAMPCSGAPLISVSSGNKCPSPIATGPGRTKGSTHSPTTSKRASGRLR